MKSRVWLGLGSNLGDPRANMEQALRLLSDHGSIEATSSLYRTEPVGYRDQGWFLNCVVELSTALDPEEMLAGILEIEAQLRRRRGKRNGPRTIDVDILLWGDVVIQRRGLTIPHPRLHQRRFVLEPLVEIAAALRHPTLGRTAAELLAELDDDSEVERLNSPTWPPAPGP